MKRQQILAATLGALMLMPVMAMAQTDSIDAAANLSSQDKDFIMKAAQGGMTEVATSKVAKKMSDNSDVKVFAQEMIDDHKKADTKLKSIAKKLNVSVMRDLDTEHQAEVDQLKKTPKSDFDQKYIAIQDKDHNEAVSLFQMEADKGDNPQLKTFAQNTLPTLQTHMKNVKALEAKMPPAATTGAAMSGSMDSTK